MDNVRFSLMWVNDPSTHQRPMATCRTLLRDAGGDAMGQVSGGLTCDSLFLDQVHIQFRPTASIDPSEFQSGDDSTRDWRDETMALYVRTSPGRRSVCYTLGANQHERELIPKASLVYTTSMHVVPEPNNENVFVRTYRPNRDLPIATRLFNVSELTVDLLWPLLQGNTTSHTGPGEWFVPNYRIERVLCDFTARVL